MCFRIMYVDDFCSMIYVQLVKSLYNLLLLDLFVKVFRCFVANDKFFVERDRVFVVIL